MLIQIAENPEVLPPLQSEVRVSSIKVTPQSYSAPPRSESSNALRASSYTIFVDLPDKSDEMLLVHGYNGAFDKVSRSVALFVRSLAPRAPSKPLYGSWTWDIQSDGRPEAPSDGTLKRLIQRGYLTHLSADDEEAFFTAFVTKLGSRTPTPNYVFMPTYDCNLRCAYCFQDHMRTDPKHSRLLTLMSRNTIDRIFAGIPEIERHLHGGEQQSRTFGFFGGEPLLAANRPAIDHIIEKARALGPKNSFWAVTNATELQHYDDILSPDVLSFVQITLDGSPAEHDKRRVFPDKSGSFHLISNSITKALSKGVTVSIRVNVDRRNVGDLPKVAETLHSFGWPSKRNFNCYTAAVHYVNGHSSAGMDSWDLDQAQRALTEQHPEMKCISQPNERHKGGVRSVLDGKKHQMALLRENFCGAHSGMYMFDAFADIYACWERTGDPSIRVGRIDEEGSVWVNAGTLEMWRSRNVVSNKVCRQCRYALFCGGGCAAEAHNHTGKYHANFCDGFGQVFREGVASAYTAMASGAEERSVNTFRGCDQ